MNVTLKCANVGPGHDPYFSSTLIVEKGTKTAVFYRDDLGKRKLTLTTGTDEREIEWFDAGDPTRQLRQKRFKARLLFKRHVGITIEEATELGLHRNDFGQQGDPYYGHA